MIICHIHHIHVRSHSSCIRKESVCVSKESVGRNIASLIRLALWCLCTRTASVHLPSALHTNARVPLTQLDIKEFYELVNQRRGHTFHTLLHTHTASMPQHFRVETCAPLRCGDLRSPYATRHQGIFMSWSIKRRGDIPHALLHTHTQPQCLNTSVWRPMLPLCN